MSELDAEDLANRLTDRAPAGIAAQIGSLIESKVLPVDSRLPTVRDLAQELSVSVGTIAQAWSHLREQGLVETRRRGGTRVLPRAKRRAEDFEGPGAPLQQLEVLLSGVSIPDLSAAPEAFLRLITRAEELEFDAVWLPTADARAGLPAPVTLLAAATQRTRRIGIGVSPALQDERDPTDLSAELAVVNSLSGDRLRVMGGTNYLMSTAIPTDTANREQEARYREVITSLSAPALIGTSDEVADALLADAAYTAAERVAFVLPAALSEADCAHILTDLAARLGPALGWRPSPR